jgi:hypothetical protein
MFRCGPARYEGPMANSRADRIARNESAFRALNESLQASVHGGRPENHLAGFVCECGDPDCDDTVRLDVPTYESVRRDARCFVILPGHESADVEDVVDGGAGYAVVRKRTEAAEIVERTDPRRDGA